VIKDTEQPWLSIITVVKDDPIGFERTRLSILSQTDKNFEWVVVDSSKVRLSEAEADLYTWTEPQGIFPAMNLGLQLCKGERVLFLNAGDLLNDNATMAQIHEFASSTSETEVIYGDVSFVSEDGSETITPPPLNFDLERSRRFTGGRFPPHQGVLAPRKIMMDLDGFDESFKLVSDYKSTLQLAEQTEFRYLPLVVTQFMLGGASSTNWFASLGEFHRARVEVYQLTGFSRLQSAWSSFLQFLKMLAARSRQAL
jgi:glycosyltransferase involved in cell wall biosynthesis